MRRFESALTIQEMLLDRTPGDRDMQLEIAATYSWLGSIAKRQWKIESAIDFHTRETDIRRGVSQISDKPNQRYLATSLNHLAEDLYLVGRIQDALALDLEALAIFVELSELDHSNLDWKNGEVIARNFSARDQLALGNAEKALDLLIRNRAILDQQSLLNNSLSNRSNIINEILLSSVHFTLNRPAAALDYANSALARIDMTGDVVPWMKKRYAEATLLKSKSLTELNEASHATRIAREAVEYIGSNSDGDVDLVIVTHDLLTFLGTTSESIAARLTEANLRYSMVGQPLVFDAGSKMPASQ